MKLVQKAKRFAQYERASFAVRQLFKCSSSPSLESVFQVFFLRIIKDMHVTILCCLMLHLERLLPLWS